MWHVIGIVVVVVVVVGGGGEGGEIEEHVRGADARGEDALDEREREGGGDEGAMAGRPGVVAL